MSDKYTVFVHGCKLGWCWWSCSLHFLGYSIWSFPAKTMECAVYRCFVIALHCIISFSHNPYHNHPSEQLLVRWWGRINKQNPRRIAFVQLFDTCKYAALKVWNMKHYNVQGGSTRPSWFEFWMTFAKLNIFIWHFIHVFRTSGQFVWLLNFRNRLIIPALGRFEKVHFFSLKISHAT